MNVNHTFHLITSCSPDCYTPLVSTCQDVPSLSVWPKKKTKRRKRRKELKNSGDEERRPSCFFFSVDGPRQGRDEGRKKIKKEGTVDICVVDFHNTPSRTQRGAQTDSTRSKSRLDSPRPAGLDQPFVHSLTLFPPSRFFP